MQVYRAAVGYLFKKDLRCLPSFGSKTLSGFRFPDVVFLAFFHPGSYVWTFIGIWPTFGVADSKNCSGVAAVLLQFDMGILS